MIIWVYGQQHGSACNMVSSLTGRHGGTYGGTNNMAYKAEPGEVDNMYIHVAIMDVTY